MPTEILPNLFLGDLADAKFWQGFAITVLEYHPPEPPEQIVIGSRSRTTPDAQFIDNLTMSTASGHIMAASRTKTKVKKAPPTSRVRHGTRALIMKTFNEGDGKGKKLSTATLVESVRRLSGTKIPEPTIRASLRTLLRQKILQARRAGREKVYSRVPASLATPPKMATSAVNATPAPLQVPDIEPQPYPIPPPPEAALPHKLAVGEVLVLHVGESHVETVSNIHGKVVLERHLRPKGTR